MVAELVVPCPDLDRAIALLAPLGFRLEMITPADDPAIAVVAGHGMRLRLARDATATALRLAGEAGDPLMLPGGLRVARVLDSEAPLPPLNPRFSVVRAGATPWRLGRAGMLYRDLLPDRQGGRFIVSHIRIENAGPVPDYVHHHAIRFQMIYCVAGWVRVVYEDQGEPFVMEPGDCVLQPPGIRHEVLESSAGLEVIELATPASHPTHVEYELALPTPVRERRYGGQAFVWFRRAGATFAPAELPGWEVCELPIASATGGFARVRLLRPATSTSATLSHRAELGFQFVLRGGVTVAGEPLAAGDAVAIPADKPQAVTAATPDLELLQVTIGAI